MSRSSIAAISSFRTCSSFRIWAARPSRHAMRWAFARSTIWMRSLAARRRAIASIRAGLESLHAELPEHESEGVGTLFVLRLLGRSEAVTGVVVDPQQDRPVPALRRLQPGRHFSCL